MGHYSVKCVLRWKKEPMVLDNSQFLTIQNNMQLLFPSGLYHLKSNRHIVDTTSH